MIFKKKKINKAVLNRKKHVMVFAGSGEGHGSHPWDCLKKCQCGNEVPWLYGQHGAYETGEPYQIVCNRCFRHTHKGTYREVVDEWNSMQR